MTRGLVPSRLFLLVPSASSPRDAPCPGNARTIGSPFPSPETARPATARPGWGGRARRVTRARATEPPASSFLWRGLVPPPQQRAVTSTAMAAGDGRPGRQMGVVLAGRADVVQPVAEGASFTRGPDRDPLSRPDIGPRNLGSRALGGGPAPAPPPSRSRSTTRARGPGPGLRGRTYRSSP